MPQRLRQLTGCVSTQAETEKIRDMKYEVIEEEDIPKSSGDDQRRREETDYIFGSGLPLYRTGIQVQPTTGYSGSEELYLNAVCIKRPDSTEKEEKKKNIPPYSRADGRCKKMFVYEKDGSTKNSSLHRGKPF